MDITDKLVANLQPAFIGSGRRFYGKMPMGKLAYYHYFFPPAEDAYLSNFRWRGKRFEGYLALLQKYNGCLLFDKLFSIFGIGDLMSRSLNPADMVADSFEQENILFLSGSERSPGPVAAIFDLSMRYSVILDEDGGCFVRAEDGFTKAYCDLDVGLGAIITCFYENLEFGVTPDDTAIARVEQLIRM